MRKRTTLTIILVALLALVLVPTSYAKKTKPYTSIEGHLQYIPTIIADPVISSNNVYLQTTEQGCWYDDLDYGEGELIGFSENGPCTVIIFGSSVFPPTEGFDFKWYTARASFEFFTVNGKTGQCVMRLVGRDYPQADGSRDWRGHWVIVEASGDLEGLHGYGTWWGPGWGATYMPGYIPFEGKIYFPS